MASAVPPGRDETQEETRRSFLDALRPETAAGCDSERGFGLEAARKHEKRREMRTTPDRAFEPPRVPEETRAEGVRPCQL